MHALEYLLFLLLRGGLILLPLPAAQRAGRLLGRAIHRLHGRRRRIALDNLAAAFPDRDPAELRAIARGAFENFGIAMAEFLRFSPRRPGEIRRLLRNGGNGPALESIAAGGGLVYLSGHFGNWELAGVGGASLSGVPFLVVVRTQANRLVDRVVSGLRTAHGNAVVPMERAVRECLATLRNGGVVALAPDQSATRESEFVPFFGREVATFRGPAAFALRAGVRMVMAFTVRRPDYTYEFIVEEVPTADLSGDSPENVRELTRRHTALLERQIRLHPDHWLWMHRRWKHLAPAAGDGGTHASP